MPPVAFQGLSYTVRTLKSSIRPAMNAVTNPVPMTQTTSVIVTAFRAIAAKFPDNTALISGDRTVTYRELERRAAASAAAIAERIKGDVVALLMPNSPEFA